jgi:hypothetical protein
MHTATGASAVLLLLAVLLHPLAGRFPAWPLPKLLLMLPWCYLCLLLLAARCQML